MRVIEYTTYMDEDRKPALVKMRASNYPDAAALNTPGTIVNMMNTTFHTSVLTEEHVWIIALNAKCHPIGIFEVSHGLVDKSLVSPREIFMKLCLCGAPRFVLVHNHPSGDCSPSTDDIAITERIRQCGDLMNIRLVDHLIIGNEYYSFKEESDKEENS